ADAGGQATVDSSFDREAIYRLLGVKVESDPTFRNVESDPTFGKVESDPTFAKVESDPTFESDSTFPRAQLRAPLGLHQLAFALGQVAVPPRVRHADRGDQGNAAHRGHVPEERRFEPDRFYPVRHVLGAGAESRIGGRG